MSEEMSPEMGPDPVSYNSRRALAAIVVAVVVIALGLGYALHERNVARQLATQNDQFASALKQTQGQVEALTAKLTAMSTPAPEAEAPVEHRVRHSARPTVARRRAEDPRWKQVQDQLAKHQQEIDDAQKGLASTQQDLSSAKTELSGNIARTHDELVLLQKKGERSYYEFDLYKSKEYKTTGPVAVKLRKANTRHRYADLDLMVDDNAMQQKHVNMFQPVMFYPQDSAQPLELVINSIDKNHIHGYVSTPKYKASELSAMGSSGNASAATTDSQAAPATTTPATDGLKVRPRPQ